MILVNNERTSSVDVKVHSTLTYLGCDCRLDPGLV